METRKAITGILCTLTLILGVTLTATPTHAAGKPGCPAWSCQGGGGGGGSKPKPAPAPKPGGGTTNPGTGGGGTTGGQLVANYRTGTAWYTGNWYPRHPSGELPTGAQPLYSAKYQACGGKFTAYDGDWLGYTWQAVWIDRLNNAPGLAGSTKPSITYSCIRPPAYTERTIFCVENFKGFQVGPYQNELIKNTRINITQQSTVFAKTQKARDCMQRTFNVNGVESMDWGLWQLNMTLSGKQCTLREYTEANQQTGKTPEPELRGCSPRTQPASAVMAVWCSTTGADPGRQVYGNSSLASNPERFIPNGVTFTANDCGRTINPKPDQCLTGPATQTTPNGTKIIHNSNKPAEVLNQGFTRTGTHRFAWTPPKPRIWDPLGNKWAQEDKSARETLSSFFDVPNDSSPRLSGKPLPNDYDKDQPFVGSPVPFGKYIPGPGGYYSVNAAWREATQKIGGTWQIVPTWQLRLVVRLTQFTPSAWDLTTGGPITSNAGYIWQQVKLSCEAAPATVVVKRPIVQP